MVDRPVLHDEDRGGGGGVFNHLPAILWQRRWIVIIPLVLLSLAGLAAALLLTPSYRSTATLLVESQDLPSDLVRSSNQSLMDRRVARLQERVLSRENLINIVRQHGLYEDEQRAGQIDAAIARVRGNVSVEPETVNGAGYNGATTIAVNLGFLYTDPEKTQAALQSLTNQFLQLNAARSSEQAQSTVALLSKQGEELQSQIAQIEGQITTIKSQYGGVLASVGMGSAVTGGTYDAQIMALQRDNAMLAQQVRGGGARDPVVVAAETALANARGIYVDSHPDVVAAQQRLREARRIAAQNTGGVTPAAMAQAQIASNNAQIAALTQLRGGDAARAASTAAAQSRAPAVMDRVAQLENRANVLRKQYEDVAGRLLAARNIATMEDRNLGERLAIAVPASLPQSPSFPNRPLVIAGGIIAGLIAGCILAIVWEMAMRPIRGVQQIEALTGVAPLVVIPILKPGRPAWALSGAPDPHASTPSARPGAPMEAS